MWSACNIHDHVPHLTQARPQASQGRTVTIRCPFKGQKTAMRLSHPTAPLCPQLTILSDPNYADTVFIFHKYYVCMHLKSASELQIIKIKKLKMF